MDLLAQQDAGAFEHAQMAEAIAAKRRGDEDGVRKAIDRLLLEGDPAQIARVCSHLTT